MYIVHIEDDIPLSDILRMALRTVDPSLKFFSFTNWTLAQPYVDGTWNDVDLFILDIRLPGPMDGLQIARHLRKEGYTGHIMLASAYSSPSRAVLQELDAEYVPKPFHIIDIAPRLLQYRVSPSHA